MPTVNWGSVMGIYERENKFQPIYVVHIFIEFNTNINT